MQKLKTENLQLQVEITVCKTFNFLLPAKTKTNKKEGREKEKKFYPCTFWGGRGGKSDRGDERVRMGKRPLCVVFEPSRRRSEEHLPNLCALALQGGK